jgi:RNA polymerase sigma-70 factor (ECF subfamily)
MTHASLTRLYQRLGPRVFRRALSLLHDAEEARDVTQDTFLAYLRAQALLRGEASAWTVLHEIATHKAIDCLRRRSRGVLREGAPSAEDEELAQGPWEPATPHTGGIERVDALHDLEILTRGESPQVLQVARLYFVEGYTYGEVGMELASSRKTISRVLRQLSARAQRRG